MNRLAKGRRAKRYQSGALSLNTPKLSFKLDDNGNPAEFGSYPVRDSNRLVEVCLDLYEAMLHFPHWLASREPFPWILTHYPAGVFTRDLIYFQK